MTQLIELTLNAEIISVDGVVNGESYAFALTGSKDGMGIWTAAVAKAESNIYHVSITAVNQSGISSQLNTIIYYGLHLVADRTQHDVDRVNVLAKKGWANMTADERFEWSSGLKGAYNYTDLNRVQSAVYYLKERLSDIGYNVPLSEPKTWTIESVPTKKEMDEYLADIRAIRGVFTLFKTTPQVPDTMDGFTYTKANDIEQILLDVDMLLSYVAVNFVYSGEIYGGELL